MVDVTDAPVPVGSSEFNPPLHFQQLAGHFGDPGMFAVANAAALPVVGNWPGRLLMAEDTGAQWRHDGDSWEEIFTRDTGFVPLTTFGTGWAATAGYAPWVRKVGNRVEIGGAITRTTTLGALATLVLIPAGFRITNPDYPSKFVGTSNTSTGQAVTLFYNTSVSHYLQINNTYMTNPPLGSGAVIPLSGSWFVD